MFKKAALLLMPLMLILALGIVACGKVPSSGNTGGNTSNCATSQTINLTVDDFAVTCDTVKVNQPVTFNDPTSGGGVHIICIGHNGACTAGATGPKDLLGSGFTIQPGNTHQVTFTQPGTYKLACTVHPNMNMTVTVQ